MSTGPNNGTKPSDLDLVEKIQAETKNLPWYLSKYINHKVTPEVIVYTLTFLSTSSKSKTRANETHLDNKLLEIYNNIPADNVVLQHVEDIVGFLYYRE